MHYLQSRPHQRSQKIEVDDLIRRCIFALITGDNVEFNLRADHGLHKLVKGWLLDSTAPVL